MLYADTMAASEFFEVDFSVRIRSVSERGGCSSAFVGDESTKKKKSARGRWPMRATSSKRRNRCRDEMIASDASSFIFEMLHLRQSERLSD